jgi:hypothetical protein
MIFILVTAVPSLCKQLPFDCRVPGVVYLRQVGSRHFDNWNRFDSLWKKLVDRKELISRRVFKNSPEIS